MCTSILDEAAAPCREALSAYDHGEPRRWKRAEDLLWIMSALPLALPFMAIVAVWIKLVSRGPVIFRQQRIGLHGKPFTLLKFRSMQVEADPTPHQRHFRQLARSNIPMVKLDLLADSRLIPLGCLLRSAGLDELPQLFNILRGEMSFVGPRPCLPGEYPYFSEWQRIRFDVLPGLTGIWQVEKNRLTTFSEMNDMDVRYVRTASPLLDIAIIARTPLAVMRQVSAAWKTIRSYRLDSRSRFIHGGKTN